MPNYLEINNISKSYGDIELFSDISFNIAKSQKIALVAHNGAGKSSLLKIISKKDSPDSGNINYHPNISIAFLEQEPEFNEDQSILENILDTNSHTTKILLEYEKSMNSGEADKIQSALNLMDELNAWDYEAKIKKVLGSLKLEDSSKIVSKMSGGQRKRLALAREILKESDLLILDEPTNHLDVEMIEWLEQYLSSSNTTLFMVTHDRYFLDRVCNNIIELDNGEIFHYKGNYSYFIEERELRKQQRIEEVEKAKNLLRKEQDWMSRMPKARGTKAKYRIDNFYKLKDKASQSTTEVKLEMDFKAQRMGTKIINLKKISKSFGDLKILDNFSYDFQRFEKVGIIGSNGTGKSTFLNILTKSLNPDSGEIDYGQTVKLAYYNQNGIIHDENQTVIEVIKEIADHIQVNDKFQMSASEFLNYFLFPYKKQHTQVTNLSGGEKRRLYILTVLMTNPNFLILDEPTNDLDIMTLAVLEKYLENFQGTLIIVSHDRFFMDNVVDHLFVFKGNGEIQDFPGNYSLFRQEHNLNKKENKKEKKEPIEVVEEKKRKLSYKEKMEFNNLESEIEKLNNKVEEIETALNSGSLSTDELIEKSQEREELINSIDEKELRWLELSEVE
jgi:ATP-binding cassette subfamily F protein uup